jgi:hypothetical protein
MVTEYTSIYEACSNKTHLCTVLGKQIGSCYELPTGTETGIPLTHKPMDTLFKEHPGLCWNHCTFTSLTDSNLLPSSAFLKKDEYV